MKRVLFPFFLLAIFAFTAQAQNTISTVAGGNPLNGTSPTGSAIEGPYGLVRDAAGNLFILTDQGIIYKVTPGTVAPSTMSIYAGAITAGYSGDGGPASSALLNQPYMGALDAAGNLYFSDAGNCVIREINATTQVITTVAGNGTCGYSGDGGQAKSAEFNNPQGIAFDGAGNMYVVDCVNSVIRKITTAGVISTYAGVAGTSGYNDNVTALQATFNTPEGIASDANGNLYVADTYNNVIRYINVTTQIVSTAIGTGDYQYSGDGGPANQAGLRQPFGVTLDGNNNVYVADTVDAVIRKVDSTGTINTIIGNNAYGFAGDGGPALQATLTNPFQIAVDNAGDVWLTDYWNGRIRFYNANPNSPSYLTINTLVGNGSIFDGGPALQSSLHFPRAPKIDSSGNLYITDTQNNVVREVNSDGNINIVAGTQIPCAFPADTCGDGGSPTAASFYGLRGIAFDNSGNLVVMDTNDSRVRKVTNGVVSTIAGTGVYGFSGDGGPATAAELSYPWAGGYDAKGNLYVLDAYNNRVRMIDTNGNISTVAGSGNEGCGNGGYSGDGGPATSALLNCPIGLDVDAAGDLFISDYYNFVIRRVDGVTHIITTVAGTPGTPGYSGDGGPATSATIAYADRVSVNAAGNLFISDSGNQVIRRVDATTGIIETFAGDGKFAFAGDGGPALSASFATPTGVVVTNSGDLYIGDIFNNRLRKITLTPGASLGPATVAFGNQQQGTTSATQTVTLTNTGDAPLTIANVATTGDFGVQTNNCTATLATGASCTILEAFSPASTGALTGVLTVTDNAPTSGSTQTVNLTGTGTAASGNPTLSITKTHTGNFTQGQANATYTVTVSNAIGAGATNDTVTVTEAAPSGLTLVSMAGTGWTCAVIPTCTRTDALAGGASYPAITVTVNVGGSATTPQVNSVTVSGGGSASATANDSTTITPVTGPTWTNGPNMSVGRAEQTATTLNSGKILIAGGANGNPTNGLVSTATADIYDPTAGTFSAAGQMAGPRAQHTAALLTTGTTAGEVLVAGGYLADTATVIGTAELYNPTTNAFTSAGSMTIVRVDHTATTLQNGQVLITGGRSTTGGGAVTATAELYNPATGTFAATGSLATARFNHTATLLSNGSVLIAGGRSSLGTYLDTAELYNPATGTFTAVPGTMSSPRAAQTATVLQDGTVLLAGGGISDTATISVTATADIYNPTTNTITPVTATMSVPRAYHTATLLSNGTVVLAGGGNSSDPSVAEFQALSSVEIYNPASKTFSFAPSLNFGRGYQTASLLPSGAVLTEGGFNGTNVDYTVLASSELYTSSGTTAPVASFAPASLTFTSQSIGTTSAVQTVTLTNSGNAAMTITGVSITGADTGDFAQTNTCPVSPATLAASANCVISVTFKPTATGARTASVSVADNAAGSPQTVGLAGTGAAANAPIATLAPTSLTFASTNIGSTTAAQTVTLTNSGTAALTITGVSITGANAGDFAQTNTCPVSPATLAANANCAISVTFKPTATGARSATVSIADNATGSPQAVTLAGTGANGTATVTVAPASLTFQSQTLQVKSSPLSVTVTNTSTATVQFAGFTISGVNSGDFALDSSSTCSATGTLAANASCTVAVNFTPAALGARAASLSIADNATGSPQAVALSGTGIAAAVIVTIPSGGSNTATSVPGGTAYYGLVLTAAPGVTGTVTLGCTPSSPVLTCSVIPSTVTLAPGSTTEVAFGVQTYCQGTTSNGALFTGGRGFGDRMGPMLLALFSLMMGIAMWTRRRNPRLALAVAMIALIVIGGAACSGGVPKGPNGVTPAGTYSLTLTTTFNGQVQSYPNYLTLVVN